MNVKKSFSVLILALAGLFSSYCEAAEPSSAMPFPVGLSLVEQVQYPNAETDIMGLRFCLLYGRHANVSGLDMGVLGCAVDGSLLGLQLSVVLNTVGSANGAVQLSGIVNNSLEDFYGLQLAGLVDLSDGVVYGGQLSCINISKEVSGFQLGLYNQADKVVGLQLGLVNWASEMQGVQIGLLNIIQSGPVPYLPLINANF